jgi:hypothetical protein
MGWKDQQNLQHQPATLASTKRQSLHDLGCLQLKFGKGLNREQSITGPVLAKDTTVNQILQDITHILAIERRLALGVFLRKHGTNPSFNITKFRDRNAGNLKELGECGGTVILYESVASFILTTLGGEPGRGDGVEGGKHPAAGDLKIDLGFKVQRGADGDEELGV